MMSVVYCTLGRRRWIVAACALGVGLVLVGTALSTTMASSGARTYKGKNGRLLFEAQLGANRQLFTIEPDGTGLRQVTHFQGSGGTNAAWSKDGSRIVLTRHWDPAARTRKSSSSRSTPTVSPEGLTKGRRPRGLAVLVSRQSAHHLSRDPLRAAHGHQRRRHRTPPCGIPGVGGDGVCFLSDGKRVAFLRPKPGNDSLTAIFIAGLFGHGLKRITSWGGHADKIDCSPDGTHIVYSAPEFGQAGKSSNVYSVRTDGTQVVQ